MKNPFGHIRRLLLTADTSERHEIVAQLAGEPSTMLDVGGVAGQLALFLPGARITTLNVGSEKADVHFDGLRIPFPDDSFEVVVSLDVLEHIERAQRALHLSELARVASRRVILCCPLGSPQHTEAERDLAGWYRDVVGEGHRFLEEHLERGLPTEEEIAGLLDEARLRAEIGFHGDFGEANRLFRLGTLARHRPTPNGAVAYVRARLDPRRDLRLQPRSTPSSNRIFVVIDTRQG